MKARIGDLPIGTIILLIGDVAPLVIRGRYDDGVTVAVPMARMPHMTISRLDLEVIVVERPR